MDLVTIVSIFLGALSVYLSIKYQIEARKLNIDTDIKLNEIKNIANTINKTADRMEENINHQITNAVNSILSIQLEKLQQEKIQQLLPILHKHPEMLKKILK